VAFFDFNVFNDPPGDPLVDEAFYLNANWDKLDVRLHQFEGLPNTITAPIPTGTEAFQNIDGQVGVWTGAVWRVPDTIPGNWSAWTTIPLLAPVVERPLFTPKYRINSAIRKVELAGGLRADVGAGPWARSKVQISANAGGIPDANKPVNNHIQQGSSGASVTVGQFAGARIHIDSNAGNSVKISVGYQGDDAGGNFVMLDQIRWFY
jgi:hypothetical protein